MSSCCFAFLKRRKEEKKKKARVPHQGHYTDIYADEKRYTISRELQETSHSTEVEKRPKQENQLKLPEIKENMHESYESSQAESSNVTNVSQLNPTQNGQNAEPDIILEIFRPEAPLIQCSPEVEEIQVEFDDLLLIEQDFEAPWKLVKSRKFFKIYVRPVSYIQGTESHPNIPMVKIYMDLQLNFPTEDYFKIMYDYETRRKWDSVSVLAYQLIEQISPDVEVYYMCNKAPWPFQNRDFIEKRYVRRRENGDIEIFFKDGTAEGFESGMAKCERGSTVLGGQIIRQRTVPYSNEPRLLITQFIQADPKGTIPPKVISSTMPATFGKWYKNLRKVLLQYKENGDLQSQQQLIFIIQHMYPYYKSQWQTVRSVQRLC